MAANHDEDQSGDDADDDHTSANPGVDQVYSDDDFLEYLRNLDHPRVAGTTDVADHIGCSEKTAHTRLQSLADDGRVGKKYIGKGQRVVWFLPETDLESYLQGK